MRLVKRCLCVIQKSQEQKPCRQSTITKRPVCDPSSPPTSNVHWYNPGRVTFEIKHREGFIWLGSSFHMGAALSLLQQRSLFIPAPEGAPEGQSAAATAAAGRRRDTAPQSDRLHYVVPVSRRLGRAAPTQPVARLGIGSLEGLRVGAILLVCHRRGAHETETSRLVGPQVEGGRRCCWLLLWLLMRAVDSLITAGSCRHTAEGPAATARLLHMPVVAALAAAPTPVCGVWWRNRGGSVSSGGIASRRLWRRVPAALATFGPAAYTADTRKNRWRSARRGAKGTQPTVCFLILLLLLLLLWRQVAVGQSGPAATSTTAR